MPRFLGLRGLSTFYIDESDDKSNFIISCLRIPTLALNNRHYEIVWDDQLAAIKAWRKRLYDEFNVPINKELKGSKIASGRNRYNGGSSSLSGKTARDMYALALTSLDCLPSNSIFSVSVHRDRHLYGHTRLEAALLAALQRVQRQCEAEAVSTLLFCDEGHAEYRTLFRKFCRHLPTGSDRGCWGTGETTRNMPLTAAIKDMNFKDSKWSHFIQIADLVSYATLMKVKKEQETLSAKDIDFGSGELHDCIPRSVLNTAANRFRNDAIVVL